MDNSLETEIRAFIVENFLFGDEGALGEDTTSLIENEVIDSTGVLELVTFMEERYGVSVADEEIVPDNLDSVARIAAYLRGKQEALQPLQNA